MRESYRTRKHTLSTAAVTAGRHIDIALVCYPPATKGAAAKGTATKGAAAKVTATKGTAAKENSAANPIPDFKTLDNAIEKILAKIHANFLERS